MSDLTYSVRAPLKLSLENGEVATIEEWSLNGLTFPNSADILPKSGQLAIPFQGVDIQFDVRFTDGSKKGELLFEDLTGRQRETLAVFYRSILSGKMASTEQMITSLDTPVDLVPMGETEEEETAGRAKQSPRILRVIWNVVFYFVFAGVVFGLVGNQILNRLSHVNLQHARVVAPMAELHTSQAAFVDEILVEEGEYVEQGEVLVRLSNPEGNAVVDDIRADADEFEELAAQADQRLALHRAQIELTRDGLRQRFVASVGATGSKNFAAQGNTADAQQAWNALNQFDNNAVTRLGPLFEMERQLEREAEDLRTRWSRLKRDLGNAKDATSAGDIVAPTDGVVISVDVFEDQFLDRGRRAIELEEDTPRYVKAWLNEARSDAIYLGMETTVQFNDGPSSRTVEGRITDITAAVDAEISDAFGLIVSVELIGMTADDARVTFQQDAPVQLRARKDWRNRLPWRSN
ncbi:HlyD family secretion protein [Loktanella sp. Alg231-35]|uniref:HlyD family secretion protein n=1 Tax=Loktanella sp. Alg231-35 TaxID=1922220 RepID=UPI000D553BF2|nr:HlyD family efflux transporter periplasmic adaptor subunit [Loktanella sp. Alg231-35]